MNFKYLKIIADAGYESEENYSFIEENKQIAFIKPANYEISKTDQEKLVSLLQTVTVTSKSDAYKQLDAKSYSDIFIFHMTDKEVSVEPFSPYLIIDGTGYKCNNKDTLNTMNDMFTSYIEVIRQTTKPSGSN